MNTTESPGEAVTNPGTYKSFPPAPIVTLMSACSRTGDQERKQSKGPHSRRTANASGTKDSTTETKAVTNMVGEPGEFVTRVVYFIC